MSKVWTEVFMFSIIFTLILEGIYIKFRPNQSKTDLCKKYTLKHWFTQFQKDKKGTVYCTFESYLFIYYWLP